MPYCIENHCYDITEASDPQIFKVINTALELIKDLAPNIPTELENQDLFKLLTKLDPQDLIYVTCLLAQYKNKQIEERKQHQGEIYNPISGQWSWL